MVKIGPLPADQRRELTVVRQRAVGRVALRAQMVLLSAKGHAPAEIAARFEVRAGRVRRWVGRDRGLVQSCWTVGLLAAFLLARFGLGRSPSSVRRYLKAADWRRARPRLGPASHAPGRQRTVDPATPIKLKLLEAVLASAATVLDLDERELPPLPLIRAMWRQGPRVRIPTPTPGQNAKQTISGALNARAEAPRPLIRPRKRAVDCVACLDHLAAVSPVGVVVLVLDQVMTHAAKLVRQWLARPEQARFRVLWLPKYTAHEHHPIARVWGLLKDKIAANRLHGSIDALVAEAERYLAEARFRAPHPAPDAAATTAKAA